MAASNSAIDWAFCSYGTNISECMLTDLLPRFRTVIAIITRRKADGKPNQTTVNFHRVTLLLESARLSLHFVRLAGRITFINFITHFLLCQFRKLDEWLNLLKFLIFFHFANKWLRDFIKSKSRKTVHFWNKINN